MTVDKIRKQRAFELRKSRKQSGLTQLQLAEISGIRYNTIRKMELGEKGWHIDTEILFMTTIINFINKVQ